MGGNNNKICQLAVQVRVTSGVGAFSALVGGLRVAQHLLVIAGQQLAQLCSRILIWQLGDNRVWKR